MGNDSYIGGLLTVDNPDFFVGAPPYYVVERARPVRTGARDMRLGRAGLDSTPLGSDMLRQLASMMTERMKSAAISPRAPVPRAPMLAADRFTLADGSVRYYVRAEWRGRPGPKTLPDGALAAWMRDMPLQILATQDRTPRDWSAGFESDFPVLLNVIPLDARRTAVVVLTAGEDSRELRLVEYSDGVSLNGMPILQRLRIGK